MQYSNVWGHVGMDSPLTKEMQISAEVRETCMLRCRYGLPVRHPHTSLAGCLPQTGRVIFNPNTMQTLADLFQLDIDQACQPLTDK